MVRVNFHNLIVIVALAAIGFWLVRAASKSRLAGVPVLGQVLNFAAAA